MLGDYWKLFFFSSKGGFTGGTCLLMILACVACSLLCLLIHSEREEGTLPYRQVWYFMRFRNNVLVLWFLVSVTVLGLFSSSSPPSSLPLPSFFLSLRLRMGIVLCYDTLVRLPYRNSPVLTSLLCRITDGKWNLVGGGSGAEGYSTLPTMIPPSLPPYLPRL